MPFLPILSKGEKLAESVTKGTSGGPKKLPYTYDEAKQRLLQDINTINKTIECNEEFYFQDEIVLCVRMAEGFLAKSYKPSYFEKKDKMKFVGARMYSYYDENSTDSDENVKAKLYFVKGSKKDVSCIVKDLQIDNFNKDEIKQLRSIQRLDILNVNEKILGFHEESLEYEVEIVFHPLKNDINKAVEKAQKYLLEAPEIKTYDNGLIFILGKVKKENIANIAKYNFLRTIHPIRNIEIPTTIRSSQIKIPDVEEGEAKSNITVGVFDGGVNVNNKIIGKFVTEYDLASKPKDKNFVEHGNAVCGAVLFGELNKYNNTDKLPLPRLKVDSFRVLPEKNIYKVIDNIEYIVQKRHDIDVFNISFGPRGPILDDQINRFTYSLDKLALNNKLFCVAAGNDGEVVEPFNRIQAPSDLVNGLGVGAYSYYKDSIYRASYSCIGAGREGAKVKPDLLEFGGDEKNLFHALDYEGKNRSLTAGTSFASPIVAGKIGKLLGISEQITPLMARTLLVHTAETKINNSVEEGYGIVKDKIKDIINCSKTKVTVLYEGDLFAKTCVKLPIPIPDFNNKKGKIRFDWTITSLSDVDALDSDIYTNCCIEDTFYPNEDTFNYTQKGSKSYNNKNIKKHNELITDLLNNGYKRSKLPSSDTGKPKSELERRLEMKWDTTSRKYKSKMINGINEPFLVLQAISRNNKIGDKVSFCVAVTVDIQKYDRNLYSDILDKYKVLTPIEIEQEIQEILEVN